MLPWKNIIQLEKDSSVPLFLQISNSIIQQIKHGIIRPGTKIPGTRILAEAVGMNRQTIVKAYDELYSQGWIYSKQSKGTFVSEKLPEIKASRFTEKDEEEKRNCCTGFNFRINSMIHEPAVPNRHIPGFHDGPDTRLIPAALISRTYKSVMSRKSNHPLFSYVEVEGRPALRKAISNHLNETAGLQTCEDHILVTRGTQMGLYLLSQVLIEKGDTVISSYLSYRYADLLFEHAGAKLLRVNVDEEGLDVDEIEKICKRKKIRAIYVTPHHHYPTTVTLSAERRMKLLQLAEQFKFIIIEDDYDYDYHFDSSPILPLASADRKAMVVYIGSFSKTLSPAMRTGYISAPANLIKELSKLRQIIDGQGDPITEQVLAELINEGELRRHIKKTLKIYHERRDFVCGMLKELLSDVIEFKIPDGGLSIWAKFDRKIKLPEVSDALFKKGFILPKGLLHNIGAGKKLNSTRMGFGFMNTKESAKAIHLMQDIIKKI